MFLLPSSTSKSIHVNPGDAPQSRRSFLKHRSKCQSFYHLAARLTLVYCHDALQLIGGNSVKVLAGLYANVIWSYSFNSWFDDTWQYAWWEASLRQHAAYPNRTWKNNSGRLCLDFPLKASLPQGSSCLLACGKEWHPQSQRKQLFRDTPGFCCLLFGQGFFGEFQDEQMDSGQGERS